MVLAVDGFYPDSVSKVSLTVAVGRAAKEHLITEFGIGEELPMNLMGWLGDRLVVVAQLDASWGLGTAADSMRKAWGCDAFTILAEGWVSNDPEFTRGKDLVDAYIHDKSGRVNECLSVLHVEKGVDTVHVCALPLTVGVRKKVKWGTLLHSEGEETLRNNGFLDAVREVLDREPPEMFVGNESFQLAMAMTLADEAGFFLNWEFARA
jgi:hypothetical protein